MRAIYTGKPVISCGFMPKRKITRLMLVDNPKILFKTLCLMKSDSITLNDFKTTLEVSLKRKKPIHIKTAHTYFYTATTYDLLIKTKNTKTKPTYRLSSTGLYICKLLNNPNKIVEYKEAIKSIILTNKKKGPLFNTFLNFLKNPKRITDIYEEFEEPTGKTLIAWCLEIGIVVKHGNLIGLAREEPYSEPTLDEFWLILKDNYKLMQKTPIFGIKRIYIDLAELRLRVLCELGISDPLYFDKALKELLSSKYQQNITLDGAPPIAYDNDRYSFIFNNKKFLYISMRDDN